MAIIDIKVPDIGDFKDVGVIELLVKPGDTVAVELPADRLLAYAADGRAA